MTKDNETLRENLANYVLDSFDVKRVNVNYVWIGTDRIGRKKFLNEFTAKTYQKADCVEILDWKGSDREDFLKEALDMVGSFLSDEMRKKYHDEDVPEIVIDRTNLVPVLDLKNAEIILFNKKTKTISEICFKAWERKLSKLEMSLVSETMRDALLTYDPYDLETFVPVIWEGMEVLKVNTYTPPPWRKSREPDKVEMPPIIWDLLEHLFPDDKCLDFVLNWMYLALIKRNETYLVLNGAKGIGKGIFCSVLAALVGREHYTDAPVSLLSGHFNAALDKKRLIVLDEFKVYKNEHTKLKKYINKFQNIEKKGIDADRASEIYNSYVVQNNDVTDMYIEADDRRFSVPDLTARPITDTIPQKDLDKLVIELEDSESELVKQFGYYIYKYGERKDLNSFSVYRGAHFWTLAYHSLREWQKFIVDKIINKEDVEFRLKDLAREFKKDSSNQFCKFPRNYQKVRDFLNNYKHGGSDEVLGEVEKIDNEWFIYPSEEYRADDIEGQNKKGSEESGEKGDDDFL